MRKMRRRREIFRHRLIDAEVVLSALPAGGPGTDALAAQRVLRDADLLGAAGLVWHTGATVGSPGAQRELQATVVAVAGVDRPVATGLAGRDRVPVHAVRTRGTGQSDRGHCERPGEGRQAERLADVLQDFDPFAERAPATFRAQRSWLPAFRRIRVAPSPSGATGRSEPSAGASCPGDGWGRLPQNSLTRRFVGLKLFAPLRSRWGRYKGSRQ